MGLQEMMEEHFDVCQQIEKLELRKAEIEAEIEKAQAEGDEL